MDQEYPKTRFFRKTEKIIQSAKTLKRLEICQRSLIHLEAWFPTCFVGQNQHTKKLFLRGDFRPLPNKNVQMLDHFLPLFFPKDSESLKILDIQLGEVGAKKPLNGTSKVNRQTHRRTDKHTDRRTFRLIERIGPERRCFEKIKTNKQTIKW